MFLFRSRFASAISAFCSHTGTIQHLSTALAHAASSRPPQRTVRPLLKLSCAISLFQITFDPHPPVHTRGDFAPLKMEFSLFVLQTRSQSTRDSRQLPLRFCASSLDSAECASGLVTRATAAVRSVQGAAAAAGLSALLVAGSERLAVLS